MVHIQKEKKKKEKKNQGENGLYGAHSWGFATELADILSFTSPLGWPQHSWCPRLLKECKPHYLPPRGKQKQSWICRAKELVHHVFKKEEGFHRNYTKNQGLWIWVCPHKKQEWLCHLVKDPLQAVKEQVGSHFSWFLWHTCAIKMGERIQRDPYL